VNPNTRLVPWPATLVAAVLLVVLPAAHGRADPAPAALPADKPEQEPNAQVEAQLELARKRLEEATREVARLSEQMSGLVMDQVTPYVRGGHALIGVQLDVTPDTAGARVHEVSPGGPAAEAGMHAGDVIVAVNGTSVAGAQPARRVTQLLRDVKPDSQMHIRVLRDGAEREFVVTPRAAPSMLAVTPLPDLQRVLPDLPGAYLFRGPLMDMQLVTLTPRLGSYFGTDKGILVVRAGEDDALKLQDGDVIVSIDGRVPTSGAHATRILSSYQPGEKIDLKVLREHHTIDLQSSVPEHASPARGANRAVARPRFVLFGNDAA
jgi:S1-C subfamily serine protease